MQIKKSKGVVSVRLTKHELRQLEGAQEIIDTVRALGGTVEDVDALIGSEGTLTLVANSEDKEAVKKLQGASSESKKVG